MPQSQLDNSGDDQHHRTVQPVIGASDGRIQPWREHWQPGSRGNTSDKLGGFAKGQEILLGSSANDGIGETILYDTRPRFVLLHDFTTLSLTQRQTDRR